MAVIRHSSISKSKILGGELSRGLTAIEGFPSGPGRATHMAHLLGVDFRLNDLWCVRH